MKKWIIRIVSTIAFLVLGYMVCTDAPARWFGWRGYGFNLCFFAIMPLLVGGMVYKNEVIKPQ